MGLVRAARPIRRRGPIAVALGVVLGLALLAGLVAVVVERPSSPDGPVYTVAQVGGFCITPQKGALRGLVRYWSSQNL